MLGERLVALSFPAASGPLDRVLLSNYHGPDAFWGAESFPLASGPLDRVLLRNYHGLLCLESALVRVSTWISLGLLSLWTEPPLPA